jgi:DNA polymerase-3 subunit delta'
LPHALLITGIEGVGKLGFARSFAKLLLCQAVQHDAALDMPCGECQSCQLQRAGTHPDFLAVEPEAEGKVIPVDQVRRVGEFLSFTAQLAGHQVAIIAPADKMNRFAANSLLKTLEEPTSGSYLLLVSSQPSLLLPTIRSRCQDVQVRTPTTEQAIQWLTDYDKSGLDRGQIAALLTLANGAPLTVLEYMKNKTQQNVGEMIKNLGEIVEQRQDPVQIAKEWAGNNVNTLLNWWILWTAYMIRLKSCSQAPDTISNTTLHAGELAYYSELQKIAARVDLQGLFHFLDRLTDSRRLLNSQVNVQMLLEDLLIGWNRMTRENAKTI